MKALRAALVLLGCGLATAAFAPEKAGVEYRDGRLTVHVREAALADVMKDVGRLTGAEVRGRIAEERQVTADFESVPVRDALERLLGEHNFALTYAEDGRLRLIDVLGVGTPPTPLPAARGEPSPELEQAGGVLDRFARSERPLHVSRRLAQALGTDRPTFLQVTRAALGSDDAGVRSRAFRATLQAIEDDPAARSAFALAMERADERGLAEFMRKNAGSNAEEIVGRLVSGAQDMAVREKAATILDRLRSE